MDTVISACAILVAVTLAASAGHKVVSRERLAVSAARLVGTTPALGAPLSFAAATVEALASAAILLPGGQIVGASLALGLWSLYAALLFRRRAEREFDCGCDFAAPPPHRPQRAYVRALMLALLALVVLIDHRPVTLGLHALLAALGFFGLNLAFAQLAALPPLNRSPAS